MIVGAYHGDVTPIFIMGAPRSGTTLLGAFIASQPGILNFFEYGGFHLAYFLAPRMVFRGGGDTYRPEYLKKLQAVTAKFAATTCIAKNAYGYCDSTPSNLLSAPQIAADFPNALFVLVLRHYAGVVQSLFRSHNEGYSWAGETWKDRAELWRAFYAYAPTLPPKRTIVVSYDALCADPQASILSLCSDLRHFIHSFTGDFRVFATSYANSRPRSTIGVPTEEGGVFMRQIDSFRPDQWSPLIEQEVWPTLSDVHDLLRATYPERYTLPINFP